ncbi:MAG TPA: S46 family peptidase, partial [Polyangia bacterium]|nr:S46 family peptidase [Polyangia bacterium]
SEGPMRTLLLALVVSLALAPSARGDEGMWTYNNFPKQAVKKKYKLDVTDQWLEHVRLSSVRFNNGGSGSFVSPTGLVMTNHHVGADCIHKLGRSDKDLIKTGFYAKTHDEEIKCPDLELNVLVDISDVTKDVQSVAKPGMDDAAVNKAQKEKMSALEKDCADRTHNRCDVVTLYHGGVYNLYTYKKYTDVRLVFAPEFQIAFFGGDPDNFEFPRYDLDVAYFRVYDNGSALSPEHYLKWSPSGARDGELVFVSGNPGGTSRLDTVAELKFTRDIAQPFSLKRLGISRAVLEEYSKRGPEQARQAETRLFGIMNSLKAINGREAGLKDPKVMSKKESDEVSLRAKLVSDPQYAKIWDNISATEAKFATMFVRYSQTERNSLGTQLFGIAGDLVRLVAEKDKPNGQRLREYRESALPSLELRLFSPAPIYPAMEEAQMVAALDWMQKDLGANDPYVQKVLAGKTPAARAHELITGTKLTDPAFRKQLAGNKQLVATSTDPMIVLARALDPERRAIRKTYEDTIEGPLKHNHEMLARGVFAAEGTSSYPDATFTLRLSYGKVAGYLQDGKKVPSMTTIAGLYERSAKAEDKAPWNLPERWTEKKTKLNGKVPMDFVSTNDIIGGNSGSPTINARGEVVGLIFDGNIESLVGDFVYDEAQNRAVSVHSAALIEALRKVYDAGALADELQSPAIGKKHAAR